MISPLAKKRIGQFEAWIKHHPDRAGQFIVTAIGLSVRGTDGVTASNALHTQDLDLYHMAAAIAELLSSEGADALDALLSQARTN